MKGFDRSTEHITNREKFDLYMEDLRKKVH